MSRSLSSCATALLMFAGIAVGCSTSESASPPANASSSSSSSGSATTPDSGTASGFCDDYGKKAEKLACATPDGVSGLVAVCNEVRGRYEGACRAAYDALITCQIDTATCVDGQIQLADCTSETSAFEDACTGSTGNDAGGCNALAEPNVITVVANPADPPAPAGGDIEDGTYDLTSAVLYGFDTVPSNLSSAGMTYRFTKNVDGTYAVEKVVIVNGSPAERAAHTWTVSGATVSSVASCGSSEPSDRQYTFDGTGLKLYDTGALTVEYVFQKR